MEIKKITFAYEDRIIRLYDINSEINKGEITTIIGPNGSGKSTLLGVMTNNYKPQKGYILLNGKFINRYHPKELAKMLGVVHQKNRAPSDMTVEDLVFYGRLPHKGTFSGYSAEDYEKVEWALKNTGLYERKDMTIDTLSGGQQQRTWIAMALAQDTPYLFLDEPTSNLDIYYQYEILELIKRLNEEHQLTIVMVLHDINQAMQYSETVIAMKDGKIIASGHPEEIIDEHLMKEVYGIKVAIKSDKNLGKYIVPIGI